jgi:lysophospholipase L1-like esterase
VTGVSFSNETPLPRLISFPDKKEISCPSQTGKTLVLLTIGQSNTGNHAGQRYVSEYEDKVVNYFGNKCFIASSPLLGTTGTGGESWTLLGNKLVASGLADRVVLVPAGIGGSSISQWKKGGDLNKMLLSVLDEIKPHYQITHILWHQGESDFGLGTSKNDYVNMFYSMIDTIHSKGVNAPIYPSIATKCGINPSWTPENQIAIAQKTLEDKTRIIFHGVDTDTMLGFLDRQGDDCHFSGTGQEKFASAWVEVLKTAHL